MDIYVYETSCTAQQSTPTKFDHDLHKAIEAFPGATTSMESEFRSVPSLDKLFNRHPDWPIARSVLLKGALYPLTPNKFTNVQLRKEVQTMILRGNHKSACIAENLKFLMEAAEKEVKRGWMIPITTKSLLEIDGAMVIPMGVHGHHKVDKTGQYRLAKRPTHDCSYVYEAGFSLNNSINMQAVPECRYGKAMLRYLHMIHQLRLRYPMTPIIQVKTDLDAAYRRVHVHPAIAIKQVVIINDIAYIGLRLPFGSSPAPAIYSILSDLIFDLANDLVDESDWDPRNLASPMADRLVAKKLMDPQAPFGKAKPLLAPVPPRDSFFEGYIDDDMGATVDIGDNVLKLQHALPLAVDTSFRPVQAELLERKDPLSLDKLQGEGEPSENKIVLGWNVNSCAFTVQLPLYKYIVWTNDIKLLMTSDRVQLKPVQTLVGRLTYIAYLFRPGRFFLNRVRNLLRRCEQYEPQKIARQERLDLELWLEFLNRMATQGISINSITSTDFDCKTWSDACTHGIGGYTSDGRAFRCELPSDLIGVFHINLLEFIAARWTIFLVLSHTTCPHPNIAHAGDNTSAVSWLRKASFNMSTNAAHNSVARDFARLLLEHDAIISNCHTKGSTNFLADILSRDTHLNDDVFLLMLQTLFPKQMPKSFHLVDLNKEITSNLYSLRPLTHNKPGLAPLIVRSKVGTLLDGNASFKESASKILGLRRKVRMQKPSCSAHSLRACEEINTASLIKNPFDMAPLAPRLEEFVRPFGRTFGATLEPQGREK